MKTNIMTRIVLLLTISVALYGCSYNELPAKTDDITTSYVLPKGELPSADEKSLANSAKQEYDAALKAN